MKRNHFFHTHLSPHRVDLFVSLLCLLKIQTYFTMKNSFCTLNFFLAISVFEIKILPNIIGLYGICSLISPIHLWRMLFRLVEEAML